MKQFSRLFFSMAVALGMATPALAHTAHAPDDAVIGNGSPGSCTNAALATALLAGGSITFNCGPNPLTISITEKVVLANAALDGGGKITLSGGNANRHFFVSPGAELALKNIALVDGFSAVGGGSIEATQSTLRLENAQLRNNQALTRGGAAVAEINSEVYISGSVLENNISPAGGAVWVSGSGKLFVSNSRIAGNGVGSGISQGGGMYVEGRSDVRNTTLHGNTALDGAGLFVASGASVAVYASVISQNSGGYGAGIETIGDLYVSDSLISQNTATGSGGGVWNVGGFVNITRTTVSQNSAYEGGGINSYGNHVELWDVNVVNNIASGPGGGGIWHGASTFFAHNVTISGNRATGSTGNGGGIYQNSDDNLFFVNATVAGNTAGRFGGGLHHAARWGIFVNSTFGDNTALAGNAIYEDAGGVGKVQLYNTAIFGAANNCDGGMFADGSNNITAGACGQLGHPSDRTVGQGQLFMGALGYNGGIFAMNTFMPAANSPAVNAGDAASCATYAPRDQRGATRAGACDVGAIEYGGMLARVHMPMIQK